MTDQTQDFARRLDYLITHMHAPNQPRLTYQRIADAISDKITAKRGRPTPIRRQYIQQLRTGTRSNPSKDVIEALAEFFGVEPAYFLDGEVADKTNQQIEWVLQWRDTACLELAREISHLSPEHQAAVRTLVRELANSEPSGTSSTSASSSNVGV